MQQERNITTHDPDGSRCQRKNGHIYVKYGHKMVKEARLIVALKEGRELGKWDRVFFRNGDRTDVAYENLAPVKFREICFKFLPRSRVIYIPKKEKYIPSTKSPRKSMVLA